MQTRTVLAAILVVLAAGAATAQEPPSLPAPTDPVAVGRSELSGKVYGAVDFGGRISHVDGDEARFQRYRDLRSGIYGTNMLAGRRTQDWVIEAQAWNVGYRDQRYQLDVQRAGRLSATFLWDQIPLFISGDTRTLYTQPAAAVFRIEDATQQAIQSGTKTLRDFEDQAVGFELRTMRKIGQADIVFNADRSTDIVVKVRGISRTGAIPFGGTFGFNNAVELPVPVDSRTADVQTALEWGNQAGMLRIGWDGLSYEPDNDSAIWDNPLRYGPDIVGTPSQGRMALWPANTLTYLHGTGAVAVPASRPADRLPGARPGSQRRRPAAVHDQHGVRADPAGAAHRPGRAPDVDRPADAGDASRSGRCRSTPGTATRTSTPHTPVFDRPDGSVSYDSSFTATAASSEYFSVKRVTFDADAAVQVLPSTAVKLGYSHLGSDYTHRIWETTAEDVFRVSTDITGHQLVTLRAIYENRSRTGDHFDPGVLEEVGELAACATSTLPTATASGCGWSPT